MSTLTATQGLNDAALALGVNDAGGSLSATQLADGLRFANRLLDNWSSDPAMAIAALVSTLNVTANTQLYTVGTGATLNIVRPNGITGAAIKMANGLTMPVEVVTVAKWTSLPDRDSTSNLMKYLFYDRASPTTGNIRVSPVPQTNATMDIISWLALAPFVDLTTPLTMQPGYERMLVLALAIEIAPMFNGAKISESLTANYSEAKATIRQNNAAILGLVPPGGLIGPASNPPAFAPKVTAE